MNKNPFGDEVEFLSADDIKSNTKMISYQTKAVTNQTEEEMLETLKGYVEISPEELEKQIGTHVRYLYINNYTGEQCIKPGGQLLEVADEYVKIKGNHKYPYNMCRYNKDEEGNFADHRQFFRQTTPIDDALINIEKRFKMLEHIVEKQQKEISSLKKRISKQ